MASSDTVYDPVDCLIMLHGDGSNNSTTITNEIAGYAFTARSSTVISTAQSKFGGACIRINGGQVDTPDHADFDIGTSDYTFDFWVWHISAVNGRYFWAHGSSPTFGVRFVAGEFDVYHNGSVVAAVPYTFSTGQWDHVAIVRSGSTVTVYVNGTSQGSGGSGGQNISGGSTVFAIGAFNDGSNVHDGYMEEIRFCKRAIWTGNFTPPTAAYSLIALGQPTNLRRNLVGKGFSTFRSRGLVY